MLGSCLLGGTLHMTKDKVHIDEDTQTSSFIKQTPNNHGFDKRLHARFSTTFEVIVSDHKESFRSHTVNLSLSGLLLAQAIPDRMKSKILDVVLILYNGSRKLYLHMKAMVIGQFIPSGRLHFIEISDGAQHELRELMFLMKASQAK